MLPAQATSQSSLPVVIRRHEVTVEGITYVGENGRLSTQTTTGDRTQENLVSSLIVVVATARDKCSSSWGKVVRFEDGDGNLKELYISSRDITTNGPAVVKNLVDEGLVISTVRGAIDALLHYLNLAPPMEDVKAVCSDRIGWHDNVYLLPDNTVIGNSEVRVVYTGAPIGNHRTVKGTMEEWRDNVAALCRGNSLLIMAVCISFSSVLLRLLNLESGGYHVFGESSTGKSTTLHVAASVHGEPEYLMGTWRTTTSGAEGRAKKCTDAIMINDELHQSNPKEAGEAVYMIMNGKGKQRANVLGDARNVSEWRLNCLSSGEMAYAAFIQSGGTNSRAGQEVRMLDISADMGVGLGAFENIHGVKDSHAFAELLKKSSAEYYGTPIRYFLECLIGKIDQLDKCFSATKKSFFEDFVPAESSGQVQRVAAKMAAAAMAGEVATTMGITGWEPNEAFDSVGITFTRWLGTRGTSGQQEAEKAVEQVKNFLLRHGMSRFILICQNSSGHFRQDGNERQYNNVAGFKFTNSDGANEFIVFN
jgi:putative DNA primase/helicase